MNKNVIKIRRVNKTMKNRLVRLEGDVTELVKLSDVESKLTELGYHEDPHPYTKNSGQISKWHNGDGGAVLVFEYEPAPKSTYDWIENEGRASGDLENFLWSCRSENWSAAQALTKSDLDFLKTIPVDELNETISELEADFGYENSAA